MPTLWHSTLPVKVFFFSSLSRQQVFFYFFFFPKKWIRRKKNLNKYSFSSDWCSNHEISRRWTLQLVPPFSNTLRATVCETVCRLLLKVHFEWSGWRVLSNRWLCGLMMSLTDVPFQWSNRLGCNLYRSNVRNRCNGGCIQRGVWGRGKLFTAW